MTKAATLPSSIWDGMPESTGSPRGASALGVEFTCGRQASYASASLTGSQASSLPLVSDDALDAFLVGTCFHWLCRTRPPAEASKPQAHWSSEQVEAARVYRAALQHDYFGGFEVVDAEWPFELGAQDAPEYFSGQADAIARVTDERFGVPIDALIAIDYKTTSRKRPRGYYVDSAQAHLYLSALKQLRNVEAVVFLEIAKVTSITKANIARHTFDGPTWPLAAIQEWARNAYDLKQRRVRNLSACKGGEYGPTCAFFIQCYGEFHEQHLG